MPPATDDGDSGLYDDAGGFSTRATGLVVGGSGVSRIREERPNRGAVLVLLVLAGVLAYATFPQQKFAQPVWAGVVREIVRNDKLCDGWPGIGQWKLCILAAA